MSENYDDIIHMARPQSRRSPMSTAKRAAQFAPFAALTGYSECIDEAARVTEEMPVLSDETKLEIEALLRQALETECRITLTVFIKDPLKDGGAFSEIASQIQKIDEYARQIVLTDRRRINLDSIVEAHLT